MNKNTKKFVYSILLYPLLGVVGLILLIVSLNELYSESYSINIKIKDTVESANGVFERSPVWVFPDFPDKSQQFNGKDNNYIMENNKIIVPLLFMPNLEYSKDFIKSLFNTKFYDSDADKIKTYHKIYEYENLDDMNNFKEDISQDIDSILNSNIDNKFVIEKNNLKKIKDNVSYDSIFKLNFNNPYEIVHMYIIMSFFILLALVIRSLNEIIAYFNRKKES